MAEWTGTVVIHRPVAAVFAFFVHPAHGWRQGNGAARLAVTQGPAGPLAVGPRFLGTDETDAGAGAVHELVRLGTAVETLTQGWAAAATRLQGVAHTQDQTQPV